VGGGLITLISLCVCLLCACWEIRKLKKKGERERKTKGHKMKRRRSKRKRKKVAEITATAVKKKGSDSSFYYPQLPRLKLEKKQAKQNQGEHCNPCNGNIKLSCRERTTRKGKKKSMKTRRNTE
jgi:FtsZ-interacting cell division protein ZipA